MENLPTSYECLRILKRVGCSAEIIQHSKIVRNLAIKIAKLTNANMRLIEAGALLHDLGRSKTHGIKHGIVGVEIGKKIGLPEAILLIIERHLGAGIPKAEAEKLGLPSKDYTPKSLEEKIIAHADNLIEGSVKQSIKDAVQKEVDRGNKKLAKRMIQLHQNLSRICEIDLDNIKL